jgi:hypothetical protein
VRYALWTAQVLLACLFLFTGTVKLVLPIEVITQQIAAPGVLVRFLGICELLGALGLILPGLLHIRPNLTPLAAGGLVIIMTGAAMYTPADQIVTALGPVAIGMLAAFVAYGRWRLAPLRAASFRFAAQPAN